MKTKGFTLLEILIALAVFAILATITSSAMYQAFNTRTKVTMQADRLSHLQLAMALIRRDTQQIVERSVHGNEFHLFPPFTGQPNYIEFTRGGEVNPLGNALSSTLKRVAYLCRRGQLIRRSWEMLDTPNRKQFQDKLLLDNLSQCSFAYMTHHLQILPDWHEFAVKPEQRQETLPTAVQLTLNLKDWGHMSALFIIPEALYVG